MKKLKNPEPGQKVKPIPSIGLYISNRLNNTGNKWAGQLKKKTAHFNRRTWLFLLAAFIILGSAICLYIIITAITGTPNHFFHF
ncbi:hypothetical protein [Sphingobacterium sp. BIGb0116]|uniref:hypothetical protein n=1 Tax=Sphingobacterium sp. BIGb0116 TaxID=2940619 RepID=UPI0021672B48|nr:hypothetical protein [Sphingobacterium sp. BIGb0116]MCS4165204.1 hypothetical protein [Sphingobacterium sp. BIGb0116]